MEAATVVESLEAVKTFPDEAIGIGNAIGGTNAHREARYEIVARLRLLSGPLPQDLDNDWMRFVSPWDKARVDKLEGTFTRTARCDVPRYCRPPCKPHQGWRTASASRLDAAEALPTLVHAGSAAVGLCAGSGFPRPRVCRTLLFQQGPGCSRHFCFSGVILISV